MVSGCIGMVRKRKPEALRGWPSSRASSSSLWQQIHHERRRSQSMAGSHMLTPTGLLKRVTVLVVRRMQPRTLRGNRERTHMARERHAIPQTTSLSLSLHST